MNPISMGPIMKIPGLGHRGVRLEINSLKSLLYGIELLRPGEKWHTVLWMGKPALLYPIEVKCNGDFDTAALLRLSMDEDRNLKIDLSLEKMPLYFHQINPNLNGMENGDS